jgi:lipopolysaccharide transport system permease protein
MFASPVIYPTSIVPDRWKWLITINPVAGIIEGFRASLTGGTFDWIHVSISAVITVVSLVCSIYVFRRVEDTFADLV